MKNNLSDTSTSTETVYRSKIANGTSGRKVRAKLIINTFRKKQKTVEKLHGVVILYGRYSARSESNKCIDIDEKQTKKNERFEIL